MTDNPSYKITFMLDSAAMITVHTPKRGVVEVGSNTAVHKWKYLSFSVLWLHMNVNPPITAGESIYISFLILVLVFLHQQVVC